MLHGQVKFKINQAVYILSGNTSFHVNFFVGGRGDEAVRRDYSLYKASYTSIMESLKQK